VALRFLCVVVFLAAGCGGSNREPQSGDSPEWLEQLIVSLQAEPVANPPATITQFRYQGATVYYLAPRCCDVASEVLSADGSLVCSPDGGLSGRGDGKCANFQTEATLERVVWRDPRGR